jgi:hypothetical protein
MIINHRLSMTNLFSVEQKHLRLGLGDAKDFTVNLVSK